MSQLEYQENRAVNLDLVNKFGANQWKLGNYQLEELNKLLLKQVEEIKEALQAVNRERKQEQVQNVAF